MTLGKVYVTFSANDELGGGMNFNLMKLLIVAIALTIITVIMGCWAMKRDAKVYCSGFTQMLLSILFGVFAAGCWGFCIAKWVLE